MDYIQIIGGLIILVLFVSSLFIDKRIKKEGLKRPYTRFSFWMVVFSSIGIVIMSMTLINNYNLLKIQIEGTPTVRATLEPKINERDGNLIHDRYQFNSYYNSTDHTKIFPLKARLEFYITNFGLIASGPISVFIQDKEYKFVKFTRDFSNIKPLKLEPLSSDYFDIEIENSQCRPSDKINKFKELKKACWEEYSIKGGIKEWLLKINCNRCQITETCYSFNICVYDENFLYEDCVKGLEGKRKLKELKDCSLWKDP